MGFNDHDDDFYRNTEDNPDFYDTVNDEDGYDDYDDSMDGDTDSALGSCGWGTDEYYGHFGYEDA